MSNATSIPAAADSVDELDAPPRGLDAVARGRDARPAGARPRAPRFAAPRRPPRPPPVVPASRVGRVEAVPTAADLAHRDELVLVGPALRRVLQARRVAERPLLERLVQQVAHPGELVGAGRALGQPQDRQPDLTVRHEARHVDRRPRLLQPLEVAGRRRPGERHRRPSGRRSPSGRAPGRGAGSTRSRSSRRPRASRLGGPRSRPRIDQERVVRVAVDVDEPGRDDLPGRVDRPRPSPRHRPIATIRPSSIPTSRALGAAPLPSTTVPCRITVEGRSRGVPPRRASAASDRGSSVAVDDDHAIALARRAP